MTPIATPAPTPPITDNSDINAILASTSPEKALGAEQITKLSTEQRAQVQKFVSDFRQYHATVNARAASEAKETAGWAEVHGLEDQKRSLSNQLSDLTAEQASLKEAVDAFQALINHPLNADGRLTEPELRDIQAKGGLAGELAGKLLTEPGFRDDFGPRDAFGNRSINTSHLIQLRQDRSEKVEGLTRQIAQLGQQIGDLEAQIGRKTNDAQKVTENNKTEATKSGDGTAKPDAQKFDMNAGATQRPTPSTKGGIDGATENLSGGIDYLQSEISRLTDLAAQHPEQAQAIMAKVSQLNNQLQALTNLMNQLMTMQSNLSKMWSELSQNAIRNMK